MNTISLEPPKPSKSHLPVAIILLILSLICAFVSLHFFSKQAAFYSTGEKITLQEVERARTLGDKFSYAAAATFSSSALFFWFTIRSRKKYQAQLKEVALLFRNDRVRPTPDEILEAQKEIVTLYNQLFHATASDLSEVATSSNDKLIKLLEELESQTLVVAIMESPERLQNSFLSQLHPRAQQVMREEIELLKQSPRL
jgi:hypothetical protein